MAEEGKKCASKDHSEQDAVSYCPQCNKYMCDSCEKFHSGFFQNHNAAKLGEESSQEFNGLCQTENHQNELEYFCKKHNELCCAKCIAKIIRKGTGQHTHCNVCNVEDIACEKKKQLSSNIEKLEGLSNTLQSSIEELKQLVEHVSKNKEEVKSEIQNIFAKIKDAISSREEEILSEIDKEFEITFFNESMIKDCEKLPEKVKTVLERGKTIDKEWDTNNNKINALINDCLNIEKYIDNINKIRDCNSNNITIKFKVDNEEPLLQAVKQLGMIYKIKSKKVVNNINVNVTDFNPQDIKCIKKLSDAFGNNSSYTYDGLCFFVSKNSEYVLAYIDTSFKSIVFYDINNHSEIKKINNAHEVGIYTVKYYEHYVTDIILTSSVGNEVKLWNYSNCSNILTIKNIFNGNSYVFSSAILFDNNTFYILCVGKNDFIKIYNSTGNMVKTIGDNDEFRRYIEISEIDENKYIITGGDKGITAFSYPSFSKYHCFKEEKDTSNHNYAKIIKINDVYNLIDVGESNQIRLWDFLQKTLIKSITSDSTNILGGFMSVNNKYLIIGSWDKEIKVFDVEDGKIVKKINKHTSYVMGIKAIKDKENNQYFVSYGGDNHIYLWSYK